jgi:tetratricopeptide (TPR) repeat protein
MKKIANNTLNIILVAVLAIMLISGIAIMSGCKDGDVVIDEEITAGDNLDPSEAVEAEHAEEEGEEEHEEDGNGTEDEHGSEMDSAEEEPTEEQLKEETSDEIEPTTEEVEQAPTDLIEEIETAGSYFNEGLYAEAAQAYRNALRNIDDAEISEELKNELLSGINQNKLDAENITETARMHHSNAMNLQYEKRFEEAKTELEAALVLYPKYQTAIDALDSLEALMGLE